MHGSIRAAMAASAVLVGAVAVLGGAGSALASGGGNDHKVTLCHATSSDKNPYNEVTVDAASVMDNGHGDHGRDIIPSFTYTVWEGKGKDKVQVEKSFSAQGDQSILANGCEKETPTTEAPVTTAKPVATTEAPATTQAPVTTEAPVTTQAPVITQAPATTAAPTTVAPKACPSATDYAGQKALLTWTPLNWSVPGRVSIKVTLKPEAPTGCAITVGLASYEAPHPTAEDIERQVLVDSDRGDATVTLGVELPADGCYSQVDAFVGPVINSFTDGDRYGDRKLVWWNGTVPGGEGSDCTAVNTPPTVLPTTIVPEDTIPEETFPEETFPEETIPEETIPETTVPVPEANPEVTVPEAIVPTPEATVVPADPGTAAPQTEAVTTAAAGRLPETGTATTGLLVAGLGALLAGLGLVQLSSTRRRGVQA